ISGGKPNQALTWSVSGHGTLSEEQKTFNAQGKATAKLSSKAPFDEAPNVKAMSMENQTNKIISYSLRTFNPTIEYPTLKNIYGTFQKTIDYDTDYSIKVKGLLPDSE
ncbi:hypothetical protein O8I42_08105, partial [Campylobacter lari]